MNTHANLPRATSTSNGRTHFTSSLRASGVLLSALALADVAAAQTTHREWHGGIFHATQGSWNMETSPAGLNLVPQDPALPSSIDILLPPVGNTGVAESVQLDFAALDPTGTLIQPGAELTFTTRGTVNGVPDQVIGTLQLVKQPGGRVQYQYDFSPIGATSYTLDFYDGPLLVGQVTGVLGGPGGVGPALLPNCDAHPWCCWTMQVVYLGGHWYNTWACVIPWDWQSQIYNANRVIVTPENPTVTVGEMTGCSLASRGIPMLPLTDMVLAGYEPIGSNYCSANPNSTGMAGTISALGSSLVSANDLDLYAFQLPSNAFGYFIVSPFQAFIPNAGGGQGNLCVGLDTGRFRSQLGNTGTNGFLVVHVDLTDMPQPNGSVVVQAGQTWNFQCWHRDANPNVTSNFTSAYSITFQ